MLKPIRPKVELLWLSTADRGRELEVHAEFGGFGHVVATLIADESDESVWVQIEVERNKIQVPIAVFRNAIESADKVHSEAWFKRTSETYPEPGLTSAARALLKRTDGSDGT